MRPHAHASCCTRRGAGHVTQSRARVHAQNPDGVTVNANYNDYVFGGDYFNGGCLKGDYSDLSMDFRKTYHPVVFPYEVYKLDIELAAFFSTQAVTLEVLDWNPNATSLESELPLGWESHNGLKCRNATKKQGGLAYRGGETVGLRNAEIICSMVVSTVNYGWFYTVGIFWVVSVLANLMVGLGIFGLAGDVYALQDQLVNRGSFSSGAVLAYVFVVPARPHDLPIRGTPTSTNIFIYGLVNLCVCAFYSFVLAKVLAFCFRESGGGCAAAFVDHPDAKPAKPAGPKPPSLPGMTSPEPPMAPRPTESAETSAPADVEQVGVEDGEGYAAVVGVVRLKKSDEEVEHNLWNVRKAAGIVDIVVWLVINLGCLIMGIAALQSAHSSYLEEIDSLVEATNAYENLFAAP